MRPNIVIGTDIKRVPYTLGRLQNLSGNSIQVNSQVSVIDDDSNSCTIERGPVMGVGDKRAGLLKEALRQTCGMEI